MDKIQISRFAPSPTGCLHVGNIRTALVAYLHIKSLFGKFILRIDDTDTERSKPEFVEGIKRDLLSVGITWDEIFYQSHRIERYKEVVERLKKIGRVYECYETALELETKRKALLKSGLPPIYDRNMLKLSPEMHKKFHESGIKSYLRFKLDENDVITWNDIIHGEITVNLKNISDPIILRSDGFFTYMLPSAVDDFDYKITDIVRGDDHITNTAIQIQMLKAIGSQDFPNFAHLPLLKSSEEKISKRIGGYEISDIIKSGIEPITICSYLSSIGTSNVMKPYIDLDSLAKNFNIKNFSISSPIVDIDELLNLNQKIIQQLPFEYIKNKFDIEENFWNIIKQNIKTIDEVQTWMNIIYGDIDLPKIENIDIISAALECIIDDKNIEYSKLLKNIKEKLPSAKDINMHLRLALTSMENGPNMSQLSSLMNRDKIINRLQRIIMNYK